MDFRAVLFFSAYLFSYSAFLYSITPDRTRQYQFLVFLKGMKIQQTL